MCDNSDSIMKKIEWIFSTSEQELNDFVSTINAEELTKIFVELRKRRAFKWQDRMLLQMIDKTPNLTFWASDKDYKVCLWEGQCNNIYGKNYCGDYFYNFISPLERINAMQDSMLVITSNEREVGTHIKSFENYYTKDIAGYADIEMITNSVQLIDTDNNEKYYGEIGLHLNLEEVQKKHSEQQRKLSEKQKKIEEEWNQLLKDVELRSDSILTEMSKLRFERKISNNFRRKINDLKRKLTEEINAQKIKWVDTYEDDIKKIRDIIEQKYDEIDESVENEESAENIMQNINIDNGITKAILKGRINSTKEVIEKNFTDRINSLHDGCTDNVLIEKLRRRQENILCEKLKFIDKLSKLLLEIDYLLDGGILIEYQEEIINSIATEAEKYLEKEESQYAY